MSPELCPLLVVGLGAECICGKVCELYSDNRSQELAQKDSTAFVMLLEDLFGMVRAELSLLLLKTAQG